MKFNPGYYTEKQLKRMGFAEIGTSLLISKNCTFIKVENISIGNNVRIDGNVTFAVTNGFIKIGSYVHIGNTCHINGTGGVEILDYSTISQGVRIYSASDDFSGESHTNPTLPLSTRNLEIGKVLLQKYALIGSGCVIMPSVTVGEGAAVGALSLVKSDLEPWTIYGGVPAKKIKKRSKNLLKLELPS
jgi:acetyltransferase-like isoleucine patch superfamily enzyme